MIKYLYLVLLIVCSLGPTPATTSQLDKKPEATSADRLTAVLKKYQESPLVVIQTKKTVESDFLEKTTIYIGELFLGRNKFRWKTKAPEASEIIFDGQTFYSIQDQQIVRSQVTSALKQQSLMAVLFNPRRLEEKFKVRIKTAPKASTLKSSQVVFDLIPRKKDVEVTDLKIVADVQKKQLEVISYRDEVGNRVEITLDAPRFESSIKKETFSYNPKPGEKIIDL